MGLVTNTLIKLLQKQKDYVTWSQSEGKGMC